MGALHSSSTSVLQSEMPLGLKTSGKCLGIELMLSSAAHLSTEAGQGCLTPAWLCPGGAGELLEVSPWGVLVGSVHTGLASACLGNGSYFVLHCGSCTNTRPDMDLIHQL